MNENIVNTHSNKNKQIKALYFVVKNCRIS